MQNTGYLLNHRLFDGFSETSGRSYIFITDLENDITRWSRNAVEYFGLPGEYTKAMGAIWTAHLHPEDHERYRRSLRELISGEKTQSEVDYRVLNCNGEYTICTCKAMMMRGSCGEPDILIGTRILAGYSPAENFGENGSGAAHRHKLLLRDKRYVRSQFR